MKLSKILKLGFALKRMQLNFKKVWPMKPLKRPRHPIPVSLRSKGWKTRPYVDDFSENLV